MKASRLPKVNEMKYLRVPFDLVTCFGFFVFFFTPVFHQQISASEYAGDDEPLGLAGEDVDGTHSPGRLHSVCSPIYENVLSPDS